MRKSTMIKWMVLPLIVAVVMFVVEVCCRLPLLQLKAEEKGDIVLDMSTFQHETAVEEEEFYEEESYEEEAEEESEAGTSAITLSGEGDLLTIPYTGYIHELTLYGTTSSGQYYNVTCVMEDGSTYMVRSAYLESLNEDSVVLDRQVVGLVVEFSMWDVTLTGATIHNGFCLNWNRMLLTGLSTACLYLLIVFRKAFGKKQELAFLTVALCVGLFLSIGLPTNTSLTFDDQTHSSRIFLLSTWPNSVTTGDAYLLDSLSWSLNVDATALHRLDTQRDEAALFQAMSTKSADIEDVPTEVHWSFSDVGYLAPALGAKLGRTLGLPFPVQLILARVFNMLFYVLVSYAAVKKLHRFKMTMACVALYPGAMYQACVLSYDSTGTALCFLGLALVMDAIMDRKTRLTWQRALGITLCFVLGSLTKIVYIPMLLLTLLLPASKFDTKGQKIGFKVMMVVLTVAVVGSMAVSVAGGSVTLQDAKSDVADTAGQFAFIFGHPLTYLGYFFSTIFNHFEFYFISTVRTLWGYAGECTGFSSWLHLGLAAFTVFTDNDESLNQQLDWKKRLAMLIFAGMSIGMVFTTLYVAFSPVGVNDFGGVQARYFLPVMPLLLMLLSPEGIKNRMNHQGWTLTFSILNLAVLGWMSYTLVCCQYFL